MKHILLSILFSILFTSMLAQTPQAFKYQAVVRDASGQILANQAVSFRISILAGSPFDTTSIVYSEAHIDTTNSFGLSNLEIGNGIVESGDFGTIDWGGDTYFLRIELDPTGGSAYQLMGTSQLLSVPYALHAHAADTVLNEQDGDPTNELQELRLRGDTLFIGGGNFVVMPGLSKINGILSILSIQQRLNAGETPLALLNNGIPVDSLYGKLYAGGMIFYVDTADVLPEIEGMVAALSDIEVGGNTLFPWGCVGANSLSVPDVAGFPPSGAGAEIGDGASNTVGIISDCSEENIAAKVARDFRGGGFEDWFLPSILELDLLYNHIGPDAPAPNTNVGDFARDFYWSSTENRFFNAWIQDFFSGSQNPAGKDNSRRVRAVRSF